MSLISNTSRKRIPWIDVAKGIGMILVVIGHCTPPQEVRNFIASFHMPLFFVLAGIVFSTSQTNGHRIARDLKRLIVPYIVTCGFIAIFLLIIHHNGGGGYYSSISILLQSVFFGSGSPYKDIKIIGEIWFLLGMFWSKRIMDSILLVKNKWVQALIVVSCMGVSIALAATKVWIPSNIDIAFFAVGFVYIGWLLKNRIDLIDNPSFLCVMIMLFLMTRCTYTIGLSDRNYYSYWYITIPGAIGASMIVLKIAKCLNKVKWISDFLSFVGRHSLLLLCIHSIDWRMPFPRFGWTWITPYSQEPWFWIAHFFHRFGFDLAVTIIIVLILNGLRKAKKKLLES